MAGQPLIATISGIPSSADVNVRSGPSRDFQALFRSPKGTTGMRVIEVQADSKSEALQGKVYQWFRLQFADGQAGWVRDDLITVVGDGAAFGYGIFTAPAVPFYVVRMPTVGSAGSMTAQPVVAQPVVVQPAQVVAQPVVIQPAPTVTVTTPTTVSGPGTQVVVQPAQVIAQPVVAQPIVAQPIVAQPVVAQPVVVQPSSPFSNGAPATVMSMNKSGANIRPGSSPNAEPIMAKFNYRDTAQILEVRQGDNNDYFKWIKISYQGKQGWVREDFVRFVSGGITAFGYADDVYPCPAPDSWWIRDFDLTGEHSTNGKHDGWDHAGTIGATINAGPKGGTVVKTQSCQKCGPEGASSFDKGYSLGDSRVWNDPAWNYGYGHYLIVRYDNNLLPASTQNFLNSKGWGGYHAFVMYAHLSQIIAQVGQTVTGGQQIAKLGNSGNSSGAHLHLELRFGKDPNAQWPTIGQGKGLESPVRLFFR